MGKKIWIAYIDDNGDIVRGFFEFVDESMTMIKIKSNQKIIFLPWHRVLKIKEDFHDTGQKGGGE